MIEFDRIKKTFTLTDDAKFNEMMDTFDVLKNNNIGK